MGGDTSKDDELRQGEEVSKSQYQIGTKVIESPRHPEWSEDRCLGLLLAGGKSALIGVFDGVGRGGPNSAKAAEAVLQSVRSLQTKVVESPTINQAADLLSSAIFASSGKIKSLKAQARNPQLDTTAAVAMVAQSEDTKRKFLVTANVGDSRIYRYRPTSGELEQLTKDHTIAQKLIDSGQLKPEDAVGHDASYVITKSVGSLKSPADVDTNDVPLEEGDVILAVSDGFSDNFSLKDLPRKVQQSSKSEPNKRIGPAEIAERLAEAALAAMLDDSNPLSKKDDVSVAVLRYPRILVVDA